MFGPKNNNNWAIANANSANCHGQIGYICAVYLVRYAPKVVSKLV